MLGCEFNFDGDDYATLANLDNEVGPADCDLEVCHAGDAPELFEDEDDEAEFEDDGQPSEYEEWQDFMGGDDWDHGQYDDRGDF